MTISSAQQVEEENAMFKTPLPAQLAPTWKLMLLSDGSVTRHLQLLTGKRVAVVRLMSSALPGQCCTLRSHACMHAYLRCLHAHGE